MTKELPGDAWLKILTNQNCRVEICQSPSPIIDNPTIEKLIGSQCDGVIGQLTEDWNEQLFNNLKSAGGSAYSNYAVGYNNVDVKGATKNKIAVGNTPGVLTETTAELAASLVFSAARRIVEADRFMRAGQYKGWEPTLFIGNLLQGKTCGVIGAGRIGAAFARMLVEGHKMNFIYFDPFPNKRLEEYLANYNKLLEQYGEPPLKVERKESIEEVLY